jgi:hypothetical protein
MTFMTKLLAGAASVAALATAAPASAQYYPGYSYGAPYGNAYGYNNSQVLAQRCTAAVQQRLSYRTGNSGGILGALFGVNTATQGRVLNVTRVTPNRSTVRVRGLATSGRAMAYNPYGVGYYGSSAYAYRPDLSFKCDIDYRGVIRDIDINRR